jgi:glycosyltransferase involved in cell wall biosynthesis
LNAGATSDLIQEGKTGFSIDFTQTEAVAERLRWILDHSDEARKIGKTGQDFVETKVNLTVSARGMVEAITSCIGVPSGVPPVSPLEA